MDFEEIVEVVLADEHSHGIPALYIVQILLILNDLELLKEGSDSDVF